MARIFKDVDSVEKRYEAMTMQRGESQTKILNIMKGGTKELQAALKPVCELLKLGSKYFSAMIALSVLAHLSKTFLFFQIIKSYCV